MPDGVERQSVALAIAIVASTARWINVLSSVDAVSGARLVVVHRCYRDE
jgi:hypothetical protein